LAWLFYAAMCFSLLTRTVMMARWLVTHHVATQGNSVLTLIAFTTVTYGVILFFVFSFSFFSFVVNANFGFELRLLQEQKV